MQILSPPYQEKLDTLLERVGVIQRTDPGSSLHISPVPGTTTPMAFAWVGPDVPQKPPYVIPTRYASLMGESWPAVWEGPTFRDACEVAQRFFVRGVPPVVPCPPALLPYWSLPPSPRLQDGPALRASTLTPQTAVLWYEGPSGPLLATDDAGAPVTAATVAPLAETYGCAVTPLDLPARTRLDALINATVPTHPRWHASPAKDPAFPSRSRGLTRGCSPVLPPRSSPADPTPPPGRAAPPRMPSTVRSPPSPNARFPPWPWAVPPKPVSWACRGRG